MDQKYVQLFRAMYSVDVGVVTLIRGILRGREWQGHKWNIRMVRRGKWKENPVDQDEKSFKE